MSVAKSIKNSFVKRRQGKIFTRYIAKYPSKHNIFEQYISAICLFAEQAIKTGTSFEKLIINPRKEKKSD